MTANDLGPATRRMTELIGAIDDGQLGDPTPCPDYTLGDLIEHVGGLAMAFTMAARKDIPPSGSSAPSGDASRLGTDWRERIPQDLQAMAEAWRDPSAWTGMTQAGGVDLPGDVAGLVALDEVVVHAWDVARGSGQPFDCDEASLHAVHGFVSGFSGPGNEAEREGLFGPEVHVPDDAPLVDRVIGMTGRDPNWSPR